MGNYSRMQVTFDKSRQDEFLKAMSIALGESFIKKDYKDGAEKDEEGLLINTNGMKDISYYTRDDKMTVWDSAKWVGIEQLEDKNRWGNPFKDFEKVCEVFGDCTLDYTVEEGINSKPFTKTYPQSTNKDMFKYTTSVDYARKQQFSPIRRFMDNFLNEDGSAKIMPNVDCYDFIKEHNIENSMAAYNIYNLCYESNKTTDFTREDIENFLSHCKDYTPVKEGGLLGGILALAKQHSFTGNPFIKYQNAIGALEYAKENGITEIEYYTIKSNLVKEMLLYTYEKEHSEISYKFDKDGIVRPFVKFEGISGEHPVINLAMNKEFFDNNVDKILNNLSKDYATFKDYKDITYDKLIENIPELKDKSLFSKAYLGIFKQNEETGKYSLKKYDTLKDCIVNMENDYGGWLQTIRNIEGFKESPVIKELLNMSDKDIDNLIQYIEDKDKIFLHIPFEDKDEAKKLGAKWDAGHKQWYCYKDNSNYKNGMFDKWNNILLRQEDNEQEIER